LRLSLVLTDIVSAIVLAAAVLLVAPGDMSHTYALIVIATSVVPGLMLTGDVKMLNAGVGGTGSHLRTKVIVCALVNLPVGAASASLSVHQPPLMLLAILTLIGAIGATAQAFSSVWYYIQPDKRRIFRSKAVSTSVKVAFVGIAIARSELAFALLGMTIGAIVEFGLNFRSLPWRTTAPIVRRRDLITMLGLAYGVSRLVSTAIRLGLGQLFGSLIASFLILEQLVGGVNSVLEKYFLRSLSLQRVSQKIKVAYILVMVVAVPWLVSHPPQPDHAYRWRG
jgi:hypothetical protein